MIVDLVVSDWKSDILPHCSLYALLVFICICGSMKAHMRNSVMCVLPACDNCETIQEVVYFVTVTQMPTVVCGLL